MDEVERQLILAIQKTPGLEDGWQGFLRDLRIALGGNLANVVFRLPLPDGMRGTSIMDAPDAPDWLFERSTQFRDVDPIPYFSMESGKVYAYEEFETVKALAYDAFHEQFNAPAGFHHLIIFKVLEPSGAQMWLTVTRGKDQGHFGPDDRALCERLAPHLSLALHTHAEFIRLKMQVDMYARAAETLNFGIIEVGPEGRIVGMDPSAEQIMEQSDLLSRRGDSLHAGADQRAFERLLHETVHSQIAGSPAVSFNLGGPQGLDLLIVPQSPKPELGPRQSRALIYISRSRQLGPHVVGRLRALFGLTETQARLAATLASGHSLNEAAKMVGVTEQTARTYIKQIFLKMGVNRQVDLIQRILTSVATFDLS